MKKLYTEKIGEHAFRRLAGLCQVCPLAIAEPDAMLCSVCRQKQQAAQVERSWRKLLRNEVAA